MKGLINREHSLFGRGPDLEYLLGRVERNGLTAVCARPQMGKTWLLEETARLLEHRGNYLVGYSESHGEGNDLFLRTVADLYKRWLSDSSYLEQLEIVWKENKNNLLAETVKTLGCILTILGIGKPIVNAVDSAFAGLVKANDTLKTGGVEIKPLQYDQALDLVNLVVQTTGKRVVLILDGWEQISTTRIETSTINAALSHWEEWQQMHMILGMRPEGEAVKAICELPEAFPGTAEIYHLPRLHLDDAEQQLAVLAHLHSVVPVTKQVDDMQLLSLIDGYPGVIDRWRRNSDSVFNFEDLENLSEQAQKYLYREFDILFPLLPINERELALRLALVPTTNEAYWQIIRPIILEGVQEELLDELRAKKVLECSEPPSYGHDKRWEAARNWFKSKRSIAFKKQLEWLVLACATKVNRLAPDELPFTITLHFASPEVVRLKCSRLCQALSTIGSSLFGMDIQDPYLIIEAAKHLNMEHSALLSFGLVNAIECARNENNDSLYYELFTTLRLVAERFPDNSTVLKMYFSFLSNEIPAINALKFQDELIAGLRWGMECASIDLECRKILADGLANAMCADTDLVSEDAILSMLRKEVVNAQDDDELRKQLSRGLHNALCNAIDLPRQIVLLAELREVVEQGSSDCYMREMLFRGLMHAHYNASKDNNLSLKNELYTELCSELAIMAKRKDGSYQEMLAMALALHPELFTSTS